MVILVFFKYAFLKFSSWRKELFTKTDSDARSGITVDKPTCQLGLVFSWNATRITLDT